MKKLQMFIAGVIVGVFSVLLIEAIVTFVSHSIANNEVAEAIDDEPTEIPTEKYIEIPGEIINEKSFQVFQVISPVAALVNGKTEYGSYNGVTYLLITADDVRYSYLEPKLYDEKIIDVPKGKVARMFGTYQYTTRDGRFKTVPKIKIVDK